jgi:hypothetical protein
VEAIDLFTLLCYNNNNSCLCDRKPYPIKNFKKFLIDWKKYAFLMPLYYGGINQKMKPR